ncbi:hypothetical protein EB1_12580 [Empedobacter brevis NBRC 14943 = ATCC 43319]|uniref:Uncharacterized protein n=1 Tax=Empedobacter brevis NBRC 14943 = ATCC 43319 TaxID=1218108 RepID=A0A511NG34_9FLAO|nr:hypothetical protein EB1_12580 [Empedobacter brevis NBRC 14943 = ATCC 43319]
MPSIFEGSFSEATTSNVALGSSVFIPTWANESEEIDKSKRQNKFFFINKFFSIILLICKNCKRHFVK